MAGKSREQLAEERGRYAYAFADTMLAIWKERITLLGVVDTRALLRSPTHAPVRADADFVSLSYSFGFLKYGIYQDFGTGREVYKGNPGDIGRDKVRERRKWFTSPFFSSCMNLREFMAESLGKEFTGIFSGALTPGKRPGA